MRIALVHPAAFPAARYGGTERVIWDLGKALTALGHKVTLVASRVRGCPFDRVVEVKDPKLLEQSVPADCDVVHFHWNLRMHEGWRPVVVTQHSNVPAGHPHENSVFVSRDHARRHGSESWVHNGLDWTRFPRPDLQSRRAGFHFLGKAAWRVKNVRGAIWLARMAGCRLDVLGGTRINFSMGFRFTLSPWVRFHGMVDDARKARVLQGSEGLIFPVLWHEPFGLAVVESMFMGCPVFATAYGALPEIVEQGVHGRLSLSMSELLDAVREPSRHGDRRACHHRAATEFSADRMARDYLVRYERVIAGERLNATPPVAARNWRGLPWLP